jgi:hypothetical protein
MHAKFWESSVSIIRGSVIVFVNRPPPPPSVLFMIIILSEEWYLLDVALSSLFVLWRIDSLLSGDSVNSGRCWVKIADTSPQQQRNSGGIV